MPFAEKFTFHWALKVQYWANANMAYLCIYSRDLKTISMEKNYYEMKRRQSAALSGQMISAAMGLLHFSFVHRQSSRINFVQTLLKDHPVSLRQFGLK